MSQSDEHETLNFTLLRIGIDKILGSIDKSASKELTNLLGKNYLETNYCYHRPDVLCAILKMIYGKSYIEMIKSI